MDDNSYQPITPTTATLEPAVQPIEVQPFPTAQTVNTIDSVLPTAQSVAPVTPVANPFSFEPDSLEAPVIPQAETVAVPAPAAFPAFTPTTQAAPPTIQPFAPLIEPTRPVAEVPPTPLAPPQGNILSRANPLRHLKIGLVVTIFILAAVATTMLVERLRGSTPTAQQSTITRSLPEQDVQLSVEEAPASSLQFSSNSVIVNGDLITNGALKLYSGEYFSNITQGTISGDRTYTLPDADGVICVDTNNCAYATTEEIATIQAQVQDLEATDANALLQEFIDSQQELTAGTGVDIDNGVINNTGVLSFNGETGAINLSGSAGITITGLTIANTGVLSLGGQTGNLDLDAGAGVSVSGLTVTNTGVLSLGGQTGVLNLSAGSGISVSGLQVTNTGVLSLGGQTGALSLAAGTGISIAGLTISNNGVTSVQGLTGNVTFTPGAGIDVTGTAISNTGVTSLAGTANQVTISGATGAVTLSLPQSIGTTSSPTFNGLTLNGTLGVNTITPSSALTIGSTSQTVTIQGSSTTLTASSGGNLAQLTFEAPTSNVTYVLPDPGVAGTYDICLTSGNCAGSGTGVTAPVNGTPGVIAKFTAGQAIGDSIISDDGDTVTIAGDLDVQGIINGQILGSDAHFTGNVQVDGGVEIGADLTVDAIASAGGTLTLGSTSNAVIVQASTFTIEVTDGSTTNSFVFATPTGTSHTITLPDPDTDATICLSTGNCIGGGPGGMGDVLSGGNSLGTTLTIGTNDNHDLVFETNGTPQVTIDTSGNVYFGSSASLNWGSSGSGIGGSGLTGQNLDVFAAEIVNISSGYGAHLTLDVNAVELLGGDADIILAPTDGREVRIKDGVTWGSTLGTTLQLSWSGIARNLELFEDSSLQVVGANLTTAFQILNESGDPVLNVDTTNGRIGVGVAAPQAELHVANGYILIDNTYSYQIENNAGTAKNVLGLDDNNDLTVGSSSGMGSLILQAGTGNVSIATDQGTAVTVANGGSIGIGTATLESGFKLTINQPSAAGDYIAGRNVGGYRNLEIGNVSSGEAYLLLGNADLTANVLFRTDGNPSYIEAGNFGIGTATPTSFKLEVAGNIGPSADDTYDLGSDTRRFKDIYVGPSSIHIGTSSSDEGVISYNTTTNSLIFHNASNSASAFQIQNAAGDALFVADTTSNVIKPGIASGVQLPAIALASDDTVGTYSSIIVPADGLPLVAYNNNTTNHPVVTKCGNETCTAGNTTTTLSTINSNTQPFVTIDASTGLPVLLVDRDGNIALVSCGNASCSSGNTTTLLYSEVTTLLGTLGHDDETGYEYYYLSAYPLNIAVPADGRPVLSLSTYTDAYDSGTDTYSSRTFVHVFKCGNATCSSGNTISSTQVGVSDMYTGVDSRIMIGSDGFPIVSTNSWWDSNVNIIKCGNASCSTNSTTTITGFSGSGSGAYSPPSMAIGADGYPVFVVANVANEANFYKCSNLACSSYTSQSSVTESGGTGVYYDPQVAVGSDGLPVISADHYDDVNDRHTINVTKCGNASCSSGNTTNTTSWVTNHANNSSAPTHSLALNEDDYPVIAFYDDQDTDLRIHNCRNLDCSVDTSAGITLGTLGESWRGIYVDTINADKPNAFIQLTEAGDFRVNTLYANNDGTIGLEGETTITASSATAFTVQNTASTAVFNVDTSSSTTNILVASSSQPSLTLRVNGTGGTTGKLNFSGYGYGWDLSTPTTGNVNALAYASVSQYVFAGDSTGNVYRCYTNTACNEASDWLTVFSGASGVTMLWFQTGSNYMFFANGTGIYRCTLATACTQTSEWQLSLSVGTQVYDMVATGVGIFAVGYGTNDMYRCVGATCDDPTDWTQIMDVAPDGLRSIYYDGTSQAIYAGSASQGVIYRCAVSTSCDSPSEWVSTYDTPQSTIYSVTATSTYLWAAADNQLAYCLISSGCDASGEWSLVYVGGGGHRVELIGSGSSLYAADPSGVWRCATAPTCTSSGDWLELKTGGSSLGSTYSLVSTNIGLIAGRPWAIYRQSTSVAYNYTSVESTYTGVSEANQSTGSLLFKTVQGGTTLTEVMRIHGANVGIGVTAPTSKLQVAADTTSAFKVQNTSGAAVFNVDTTNGRVEITSATSAETISSVTSIPSTNATFGTLKFQAQSYNGTRTFSTLGISTSAGYSVFVDSVNGVIYSGQTHNDNLGYLHRCVISSGCDAAEDWTTNFTLSGTSNAYPKDFAHDTVNGVIYATTNGGNIYRCVTSTGCDAQGDWTQSTTSLNGRNIIFDSVNNQLLAGVDGNSLYRCPTSSACDANGDWASLTVGASLGFNSFVIDSANGVLYTTTTQGSVYRCALSTGCDTGGEVLTGPTTLTLAGGAPVSGATIDTANGVIYLSIDGSTSVDIYRCVTSTGCDASGEWTSSFNAIGGSGDALSIEYDGEGTIHAGFETSTAVWKCSTSSSCDDSSDWSVAASVFQPYDIATDRTNRVVYVTQAGATAFLRGTPNGSSAAYGQLKVSANATGGGTETGVITFNTLNGGASSDTLTIAGNAVGIGTTAPAAMLQVAGNVLFKNGTNSTTAFQVQNAAGSSLFVIDSTNGNFGFRSTSYGSGQGVIAIANATTVPTTNPSGGGILYAESGRLKWRRSDGTVDVVGSPLLGYASYSDSTVLTTSSTTASDVQASNLAVTFTVPESGTVMVRLTGLVGVSVNGGAGWNIRDGSSNVSNTGGYVVIEGSSANTQHLATATWVVTGLTPGATLTWKWGFYVSNGAYTQTFYVNNHKALMEVWRL